MFTFMLKCRKARIGYIKSAGVGKIVGILLVFAEEQTKHFVPGIFGLIKCSSQKNQSSAISITIIFHSIIRPGGNTVQETIIQNSTYNYTSDPCDYNGELIFPR